MPDHRLRILDRGNVYDITDLELRHHDRDPQLAELRTTPGIPHDRRHDLYYVSRYEDVSAVAHDPLTFSSAPGVTYFESLPLSFVTMDDPEHSRLRRLVSRQFTPRVVTRLRERAASYTAAALDSIEDPTDVDVVDVVHAPVTLRIIADMLGLPPEDLPKVKLWTDEMMDAGGRIEEPGVAEQAMRSFAEWTAYVAAQVAQRQHSPGGDLLSALAHAEDERLDADELAMFATALMVAGNETTRHSATRGLEALIDHPEQRRRLRAQPQLMRTAVEEILRYTSVVRHMIRTTTSPTVLAGTLLPEGARVVLLYPSANRDELVFKKPDQFVIDRSPNQHLAFGVGTHYCLGANLARMELDMILSTTLGRWPDPCMVPGTQPVHRANGLVAGVSAMRVDLTGRSAASA